MKLHICCRSTNGKELLLEQKCLSHFSIYLYSKSWIQKPVFSFFILFYDREKRLMWKYKSNFFSLCQVHYRSLPKGKTYFPLLINPAYKYYSISIFVFLKSNRFTSHNLIRGFCFFLENTTKQNKNKTSSPWINLSNK